MPISLQDLERLIRAQRCADTAWTPDAWNSACPAAGQCFSTAFVVKSLLDGEIVHAEVLPHTQPKQRHAWNRLGSGVEIDLTRKQFPPGQAFLPCELPDELVWSVGGRQASLLLERVRGAMAAWPAAALR